MNATQMRSRSAPLVNRWGLGFPRLVRWQVKRRLQPVSQQLRKVKDQVRLDLKVRYQLSEADLLFSRNEE